MFIEEASPDDHQALTRLMRQSKAFWKYDPQQLARWQEELTVSPSFIKEKQVFKLLDGQSIVAFYAYTIHSEHLKLESFFVLPEYIGQGIGKLLMDDFLLRAQKSLVDTIILDADPNAEGFYQSFGFQTVSLKPTAIARRFMPIMVKRLISSETECMNWFKTERMSIRNLVAADLEAFYDMQRNPKVMKFVKPPMTYEQTIQELERFIRYYERRDKFFRIWAVVEKLTDAWVGICGVYQNEKQENEIAYRLREQYWGGGLGNEVAKGLIRYCFSLLQYDELVAYVSQGNTGSIRIIQQEMELDQEFYSKADQGIEQIYRIRRENWLQRQP